MINFEYQKNYDYNSGWDAYALTYVKLLQPNTVYSLTKKMAYFIIEQTCKSQSEKKEFTVLDINCGTGNDFPFFFSKGWNVVAFDGSSGMLNKAAENYASYLKSGQLKLYQGMLEDFCAEHFNGQKFDLIYSITGGFSYINNEILKNVNTEIAKLLLPKAYIALAHLTPFSLSDALYRILKRKNPFYRNSKNKTVAIKGEMYRMFLRNLETLKPLYAPYFSQISYHPLLAITPPYQSGFAPKKSILNAFEKLEKKLILQERFCALADQIMLIGQAKN